MWSTALSIIPILLSHKQDAQGVGTAVGGDGATGAGDDDLAKLHMLLDGGLDDGDALLGDAGVGDEDAVGDDILATV